MKFLVTLATFVQREVEAEDEEHARVVAYSLIGA